MGLNARTALGSLAVGVFVVVVFGLLATGIDTLRSATDDRQRSHALQVDLALWNAGLLDADRALRGYAIDPHGHFLTALREARARLPELAEEAERAAAAQREPDAPHSRQVRRLVAQIRTQISTYEGDVAQPLIGDLGRRELRHDELHRRLDAADGAIGRIDGLFDTATALALARTEQHDIEASDAADIAIRSALGGLALLLVLLFVGVVQMGHTVTRPVTDVAARARALAQGATVGPAPPARRGVPPDVRSLSDSFDTMAAAIRSKTAQLQDYSAMLERRIGERTADLERARYEALRMLAAAAEFRDDDTHRHTERVGRNAALLARELGLSDETVALLRAAAPLHDVGKIGISDTILLKPGRLTPEEYEAMKEHVVIGARILGAGSEPLFVLAAEIAHSHHERWDGSGYPDGRAGAAIPMAARIVSVIDVFDALTHERPYKDAWPVPDALAEIRRGAGTQFDPRVVEAFERLDPEELLADLPADSVVDA